jgi:NAD dependent epimerase/dehydratase family enzyme
MQTFRKILQPIIGLPAPRWMLKMGAAIIGTETELLLKSRWVVPEKLQSLGFQFNYLHIEDALKEILNKNEN